MADENIKINVMPVLFSEPNTIQQVAASQLMNCKSCGHLMYRSTQCERCGAWCR